MMAFRIGISTCFFIPVWLLLLSATAIPKYILLLVYQSIINEIHAIFFAYTLILTTSLPIGHSCVSHS